MPAFSNRRTVENLEDPENSIENCVGPYKCDDYPICYALCSCRKDSFELVED